MSASTQNICTLGFALCLYAAHCAAVAQAVQAIRKQCEDFNQKTPWGTFKPMTEINRKKKRLACKCPFHAEINLLTFLQKHKINFKTVIVVSHEVKHPELFFFFLFNAKIHGVYTYFFQIFLFPRSLPYSIQKRQIMQRISKFSTFLFYALNKRFRYMRKRLEAASSQHFLYHFQYTLCNKV